MTGRPPLRPATFALLRERVALDAGQRGLAVRPQDVDVEVVDGADVPGAVVFVASWGVHPGEEATPGVLLDDVTVVTGPAPAVAVVLDRWRAAPPAARVAAAVVARLLDPSGRNDVLSGPADVEHVPVLRAAAQAVRPPRFDGQDLVFDWRTPYGIEEVTVGLDEAGSLRLAARRAGAEEPR